MKKVVSSFLLVALVSGPFLSFAQNAPPGSDLRQLVEAMQRVAKPNAGQKLSPLPPAANPKQVRLVSFSTLPEQPLPLLIANRRVPFDSLNKYTLQDVQSVTLDNDQLHTALYGSSGSWGIIQIKLKERKATITTK